MKSFRFKPPLQGVVASVGSLFGQTKNEEEAIDVDKDGKSLFKEDIIKKVFDDLAERKTERSCLETQWTLNANFLVGNQFCEINPYRGGIEQTEAPYDWMEREAFNQIAPLIETRIANLQKITFQMKVKPATNELSDYHKADIATSILRYVQTASDFNKKIRTLIHWNELCGNCFMLCWWDTAKGDKIAEEELTVIGDNGIEHHERKGYFSGDVEFGLLTPYEVYPESMFKQGIDSQRSIILEQVKTADDVYDLYGVEIEGTDVESFQLTPIASGGGFGYENTVMSIGHKTVHNAVKLTTYFERPSKRKPKGQMIIIAGEDKLVYYGDLPYSRIPIVQVVCREVAGQFFGKSAIEDLIPRQKAYNGCLNRIHEYLKRVSIGNFAVVEGSIDMDEYEEEGLAPGKIIQYREGSAPPVPLHSASLPNDVMIERQNLRNDMEYVAGTSQLMVNGATPSGVTSGTAIENLMAIDSTRMSLTGDHIREAIKGLSVMILELYKQYTKTRRLMNIVGSNEVGKVLTWTASDINSYDVEFITENELMTSEDMQKQRFFDAYNMGFFTDSEGKIPERVKIRGLEFMKMGNYSELLSINTLQMQAAQRENAFYEEGVMPNISELDDHSIHYEEHMRYALQMNFHVLQMEKPEYAGILIEHINQHKQAMEEMKAPAMLPGLLGGI